jgi:hypothetical protein
MDKPFIIEWLLPSGVILTSVLGVPTPDVTDARRKAVLRQWIPYAARGWRRLGEEKWRRVSDLPQEWKLKAAQGGPPQPLGGFIQEPEDGYREDGE